MRSPISRWVTATDNAKQITPILNKHGIDAAITRHEAGGLKLEINSELIMGGAHILNITHLQLAALGEWLTAITMPLSDDQWACMQRGEDA